MTPISYLSVLQLFFFQGEAVEIDHKGQLKSIQILPKGMLEQSAESVVSRRELQHSIMATDGRADSHIDTSFENERMKLVRSEPYELTMPHAWNSSYWAVVTDEWMRSAVSRSKILSLSKPIMDWITHSSGTWNPISLLDVGVSSSSHEGCEWIDSDQEKYVEKLLMGSFIGAAVAGALLIAASAIMCCGCYADSVIHHTGKFGMFLIFTALLCAVIPAMSSFGACKSVDDDICDECYKASKNSTNATPEEPCTLETRQAIEDACQALGLLVVYIAAYGWLAVILGSIASSMGCCAAFGCCACHLDYHNYHHEGKEYVDFSTMEVAPGYGGSGRRGPHGEPVQQVSYRKGSGKGGPQMFYS